MLKKTMITTLAAVTLATTGAGIATVQPQTAHASLIGKLVGITYLYKNRGTISEMLNRGKRYAKSEGIPKFETGAAHSGSVALFVQTKKGKHEIGKVPSGLAGFFTRSKNAITNDLKHLGL